MEGKIANVPEEAAATRGDMSSWHTMKGEEVLAAWDSRLSGLDEEEIRKRRERYGENVLPAEPPVSLWKVVLRQFKSPIVYVLLAATLISLLIQEYMDALFVFFALMLNAVIGTYQEWNAQKRAQALLQEVPRYAQVVRGGHKVKVPAEDLVPGDIVLLEDGARVPADLRLLEQHGLSVDESQLTGESVNVDKETAPLPEGYLPLGDRTNMAYASTVITRGSGLGVVVATGEETEIGKIAQAVSQGKELQFPLAKRMEVFTRQITIAVLCVAILLGILALFRGFGFHEVFILAVALAVSAIPEGLPAGITIALSIGMNRMTRRSVVVRNLMAVEGLGSCTMVASDKTGTLTHNQMMVQRLVLPDGTLFQVTGEGYQPDGEVLDVNGSRLQDAQKQAIAPLIQAGVMCNAAELYTEGGRYFHQGDPVDIALLVLGEKTGMSRKSLVSTYPPVDAIPFMPEQRYAATFYEVNLSGDEAGLSGASKRVTYMGRQVKQNRAAVKGALETVLPMCSQMIAGTEQVSLRASQVEAAAEELAAEGYRVLAFAEGVATDRKQGEWGAGDLHGLTFLGIVGMIDPLREEAVEAVEECRQAGVAVSMVTGDHPVTALAIADKLGIAHSEDEVITGADLERLSKQISAEAFQKEVSEKRVFARVEPLQKQVIVEALMAGGQFVAVTGDGVNDAPALKEANIGVAMGSGTDVAKDAADIVISDDRFNSIVEGIKQGRVVYNNIRKVLYLLLSTGVAEVLLFILAVGFGYPLPLSAVQILWLNLVTNGIQDVALAFEPEEGDEMKRPPRPPRQSVLDRLMASESLLAGMLMGGIGFGLWVWLMQMGMEEAEARNLLLMYMVLAENFHCFNSRSERLSVWRIPLFSNSWLITSVLGAQALHLIVLQLPPMQFAMQVEPVSVTEWFFLLLLASIVLWGIELFKRFMVPRLEIQSKA